MLATVENWCVAVAGIAMLYWFVRPSPSARLIDAITGSYASTLRAALGAVESRDPLAPMIVDLLDPETRTDVMALLSPADKLWIDTQMGIASE